MSEGSAGGTGADTGRDHGSTAFATFRPVRGRWVAIAAASLIVAVFTGGALLLPGPRDNGQWHPFDRVMLVAMAVVIALFLLRYAAIRAVPTRTTLTVRNLLTKREVEWREILAVQFAGGDPWVTLDLADTDSLAVMAIQKADGPRARKEAARLAALVAALGEAEAP